MNIRLHTLPALNMGFRPFFLGAGIFAVVIMLLWSAMLIWQMPLNMAGMSMFEWHAHEMFYGYALAVISGFLLTSVRTWTQLPTAHGSLLLLLFTLWLAARICLMFGSTYVLLAACFDLLFAAILTSILTYRIIQVKQWQQLV